MTRTFALAFALAGAMVAGCGPAQPPTTESGPRTAKKDTGNHGGGTSSLPAGTVPRNPYVLPDTEQTSVPKYPSKDDSTSHLISYLTGAAPNDFGSAHARAMAIDILAQRKAKEAIPYLVECLKDFRGLTGSDNWVGGHAANALSAITGRSFSVDYREWSEWWDSRPKKE